MKISTIHNRLPLSLGWPAKIAGTVVLEDPNVDVILDCAANRVKNLVPCNITVNVGAAFLHPKDQLNKKEGRKLALERMKPIDCSLEIRTESDGITVALHGIDNTLKVRYSIYCKVYNDSRKLRVTSVKTSKI
jgi:hypothetical protein